MNTGGEEMRFQALLHTYLAAAARSVRVSGLKGCTYIDKMDAAAEKLGERCAALRARDPR
jgi:hypothetical protein